MDLLKRISKYSTIKYFPDSFIFIPNYLEELVALIAIPITNT